MKTTYSTKEQAVETILEQAQAAWTAFKAKHNIPALNSTIGIRYDRFNAPSLTLENAELHSSQLGIFSNCIAKAQMEFFNSSTMTFDMDENSQVVLEQEMLWSSLSIGYQSLTSGSNGVSGASGNSGENSSVPYSL